MKKSTFTRLSVTAVLFFGVTLAACSEEQSPAAQSVQTPAVPTTGTTAPVNESAAPVAAPVPAPIAATAQTYFSPEALETLLAPVALYPDPILAQVLASSINPQEVLDAGNWLVANPTTTGKELDIAAAAAGFTPPMMALMQFPTVVDMMCMKMDWTTELGSAFQADQAGVLAAVQRLRKQAAEMGNLKSSDQMKVTTEEQNSQQVIVVQPANPEVIYVPQYNPTAVYTTPAPVAAAPATATAVATTSTGYSGGEMITAGLLSFGAGMLVNEVFSDDDDNHNYYSPNYGYGGSPYYPPPYQPRYGNGFRPANGYNRPPNYQNGFNNNNNIYVNNSGKDYFDKFDGGRNNYRKNADSPISAARPNRAELGELNQRAQSGQRQATYGQGGDRKVQGNYAGAKPGANSNMAAQRPGANNKVPSGTYAGAKPGTRPDAGAQRPAMTSKVPKGTYAGAANPAARQKLNPQTAGTRDRGRTGEVAKPAARQQTASKPAARKAPASHSSAFQGSRNHGKAERAASDRGRASMPKGSRSSANRSSGHKQGNRSGQNRGGRR